MEAQTAKAKRKRPVLRAAIWGASICGGTTTLTIALLFVWHDPGVFLQWFAVAAPGILVADVVGPLLGVPDLWHSALFVLSVNTCLGAAAFAALRALRRALTGNHHENPTSTR